MKNKYGRDLSTPLAPTYGGPGPITKKMADKVTMQTCVHGGITIHL